MDAAILKRLSKQMSWILRHEAERLRLDIDPEGYVPITDVLRLLRAAIPEASAEWIGKVIETVEPGKQRFSIAGDYIRANYGHSLAGRIAYQAETPPAVLYHGTSVAMRARIMEQGLRPMGRQFVHLTTDAQLARQVGGRHGTPCVLVVDAARAAEDGLKFYRANRGFWLAEGVEAGYLDGADD